MPPAQTWRFKLAMLNTFSARIPVVATEGVTAAIELESFKARDADRWDEFVRSHPDGTPFHLIAWKRSIEATFGYKPYYLIAKCEGQICAVLPLFLVQNPIVRKALVSSPFAVYGGVLASSPEAAQRLRLAVENLASGLGVQYVELRNWKEDQTLGFERTSRYVTFQQPIGSDAQAILEAIPRKTRAAVRKSLKFGLESRTTDASTDFEDLYSRNLRRLGTPAFPKSHFRNLLKNFGNDADIREVVHNGRTIAAVLTLYFKGRVLPYYGASDPEFNALQPNNFMYFDLMCRTGALGYREFDFGRSKKGEPGSYDFKTHWGMEERMLPYEMLLVRRKEMPHFSPANPKFTMFIAVWRRLPLAVTRWLGPKVIRMFP